MTDPKRKGLVLPGDGQAFGMTWGEMLIKLRNELRADATTDILAGSIETRLKADVVWKPVPLNATNWQNFGGGWIPLEVGVTPDGTAHLHGTIASVAGYNFGTPATLVVGTLPLGTRPVINTPAGGGSLIGGLFQVDTANNSAFVRCDVQAGNGVITLNQLPDVFTGGNNGTVQFGTLIIPTYTAAT